MRKQINANSRAIRDVRALKFPADLPPVERDIIASIINEAASRGWRMRVRDEEDWSTERTGDPQAIAAEVGATDLTVITFYAPSRIGSVAFAHGEGEDVITDYTDNEDMNDLVESAQKRRRW